MSLANEIIFGTKETVIQLLQAGEDINEVDEYGYTPLIETAIADKIDIAALLLEKGAQVNKPDMTGRTALHWAVDNQNIPLCQLLLQYKANPNAYTIGGQPVFVDPLLRRQYEIKKLLYHAGADLNFAQDFINTKLIGHRFELIGKVHLFTSAKQFIELDFEGFYLEFTLGVIQNSLHRFRYNFAARHLQKYFKNIKKVVGALSRAEELSKYRWYSVNRDAYKERIDTLLSQDLLLLPISYGGHAVTFMKYGNLFVKCDRGEGREIDGCVAIYTVGKPHLLTTEFIKKLLFKRQDREFIFYGLRKTLGLNLMTELPIPPQLSGNCSWANVEGSVPALLFLLLLEHNLHDEQQINHATEQALAFYKQWQEWDKNAAIYECIQSFKRANRPRKASKAAMLAAVLFQACDYDASNDLERAGKILDVVSLPEYQFLIKAYFDVYYTKMLTPEGKNLKKILDYYDVLV